MKKKNLKGYDDGGDVSSEPSGWERLKAALEESFKKPTPPAPAQETQDEKYTRIRKENSERFQGQRPDFQGYADGGRVGMGDVQAADAKNRLLPTIGQGYSSQDDTDLAEQLQNSNRQFAQMGLPVSNVTQNDVDRAKMARTMAMGSAGALKEAGDIAAYELTPTMTPEEMTKSKQLYEKFLQMADKNPHPLEKQPNVFPTQQLENKYETQPPPNYSNPTQADQNLNTPANMDDYNSAKASAGVPERNAENLEPEDLQALFQQNGVGQGVGSNIKFKSNGGPITPPREGDIDYRYSNGGQVERPPQQKLFQANSYFGKGANGAGEGVANSMGIRMADGGEVKPTPTPAPTHIGNFFDSNQPDKVTQILKQSIPGYAGGEWLVLPHLCKVLQRILQQL
jgi:hypothetical protein